MAPMQPASLEVARIASLSFFALVSDSRPID
jgi:hypothetical protein